MINSSQNKLFKTLIYKLVYSFNFSIYVNIINIKIYKQQNTNYKIIMVKYKYPCFQGESFRKAFRKRLKSIDPSGSTPVSFKNLFKSSSP